MLKYKITMDFCADYTRLIKHWMKKKEYILIKTTGNYGTSTLISKRKILSQGKELSECPKNLSASKNIKKA